MAGEPGQQEQKSSGTASGSALRIESTPAIEGEGGIRTGSLKIYTEYHVLEDGTVHFGSREEALRLNEAAKEKGTKV